LAVVKYISCLLWGWKADADVREGGAQALQNRGLISPCSQEGQSPWKTQGGVPRLK